MLTGGTAAADDVRLLGSVLPRFLSAIFAQGELGSQRIFHVKVKQSGSESEVTGETFHLLLPPLHFLDSSMLMLILVRGDMSTPANTCLCLHQCSPGVTDQEEQPTSCFSHRGTNNQLPVFMF